MLKKQASRGGWNPLDSNSYGDLQYLVVDTSLFSAEFQSAVISALSSSLSDFDSHINGTLIHSDNFQALNLLQARYKEQVKCIYIDPPYNTGGDGFIYKDGYQSSSWASLIHNRLTLAKSLLNQTGVIFQSIDDNEQARLKLLSDDIFGKDNFISNFIRKTKSVTNVEKTGVNVQHEYLICHSINKANAYLTGGEKDLSNYTNPDNDPNGEWISDNPTAPRDGDRYPIVNPFTKREDVPPKGRAWFFSRENFELWVKTGKIKFKETHSEHERGFILKRYKNELNNTDAMFDSLLIDNIYLNQSATKEQVRIFGDKVFGSPKPVSFNHKLFSSITHQSDFILDYFAGSGTTAHAVINLNREDSGNRQYILVEQGEYFDTVLKPRVQKVIFSKEYKDGKPVPSDKVSGSLNGVPQIVKVLKLESYEDTLNNLELHRSDLFDRLPEQAQHDYLLHYMLNIESRDSLLNVSHFAKPFDYGLNISQNSAGAYQWQKVDLVETFNYLIGARVIGIDDKRIEKGFVAVECRLPNQNTDEKTLIFWRDCERIGYDELQTHFDRLSINPADGEYSQVYINGDHTLETVWDGEQSGSLKIRSIEAEFLALMFAGGE